MTPIATLIFEEDSPEANAGSSTQYLERMGREWRGLDAPSRSRNYRRPATRRCCTRSRRRNDIRQKRNPADGGGRSAGSNEPRSSGGSTFRCAHPRSRIRCGTMPCIRIQVRRPHCISMPTPDRATMDCGIPRQALATRLDATRRDATRRDATRRTRTVARARGDASQAS
jgi:hypothetical protein